MFQMGHSVWRLIVDSFGEPRLWVDALSQNAFDTGAGMGLMIPYASFMTIDNNIVKYGMAIPSINNLIRYRYEVPFVPYYILHSNKQETLVHAPKLWAEEISMSIIVSINKRCLFFKCLKTMNSNRLLFTHYVCR